MHLGRLARISGAQIISLAAMLALASGCASFRAGELEPIEQWPPDATGAKQPVNVTFQGVTGQLLDSFREPTLRAYGDSGLFSAVTSNARAGSGIRADVSVAHRGDANIGMAMLTGLTLYLVPSKASDQFTVTTTFTNAQGKQLYSVTNSETVTLWQQLFMVFVMPGKGVDKVSDETFYDLGRASLSELAGSGKL